MSLPSELDVRVYNPKYLRIPPAIIANTNFKISWEPPANKDVQGDITAYRLEKSIDSGAYNLVYRGPNQEYTDTMSDSIHTIQYRICPIINDTFYGEYTYSPLRYIETDTDTVTLGNLQIGDVFVVDEGASQARYIVGHIGRMSDDNDLTYHSSCEGMWCFRQNSLPAQAWQGTAGSSINDYARSNVHTYLNSTYYDSLQESIRDNIKPVILPCKEGIGTSPGGVLFGKEGIAVKIFLLSTHEVGLNGYPKDGEPLSYFTTPKYSRICKDDYDNRIDWWLRSAQLMTSNKVVYVSKTGGNGVSEAYIQKGVRPAMILPYTTKIAANRVHRAPMTCPSIIVPEYAHIGTPFSVFWLAASDGDDNLLGYKLYRQFDEEPWTLLYDGKELTIIDEIPEDTAHTTVRYKVCSYDTDFTESDPTESTTLSILSEVPPYNVDEVTLPRTIYFGDVIKVEWTPTTDLDGDFNRYILERSVNNGESWTQVYSGTDTYFRESISANWPILKYRVCATDRAGHQSGYTYSKIVVISRRNIPPLIQLSQSGDLGVLTDGFNLEYIASDEDSDELHVISAIDGKKYESHVEKRPEEGGVLRWGSTVKIEGLDWLKTPNGEHIVTIKAGDLQDTSTQTITFKRAQDFITVTRKEPYKSERRISACRIYLVGDIPNDAIVECYVTNNGLDSSPVYEDCHEALESTKWYIFTNLINTSGFALNFKLKIACGPSGKGGFLRSIKISYK